MARTPVAFNGKFGVRKPSGGQEELTRRSSLKEGFLAGEIRSLPAQKRAKLVLKEPMETVDLNPRIIDWSKERRDGLPEWVRLAFNAPDLCRESTRPSVLESCRLKQTSAGDWTICGPAADILTALENGDNGLSRSLAEAIRRFSATKFTWVLPDGRELRLGERTLIMGVLNVTPDSFSDGGKFFEPQAALHQALEMIDAGADIIDVGGMSTRPASDEISADEEVRRVLPVVEALAKTTDTPVSIDSCRADVAERAIDAGAQIINDISAMRFDPRMVDVAAKKRTPVCLMHIKGSPKDMQRNPTYADVMAEIIRYLYRAAECAVRAGIAAGQLCVDPGIGFGKTVAHNLRILQNLGQLRSLGCPILVGTSRKSFIGAVCEKEVDDRIFGTASSVALAAAGADIVRVHDVGEMRDVVRLVDAVKGE